MYLVYKTDNHHNFDGSDIIGVSEYNDVALNICILKAEFENEKLTKDDISNLKNISQTQGYSGEGEFFIESVAEGELL